MIYIAHRGNITGKTKHENAPGYVSDAISLGFYSEIDVWMRRGKPYLGHDAPTYKTSDSFWSKNWVHLWCHAKDLEALAWLESQGFHHFWHNEDVVTITSRGCWWYYPSKEVRERGINVLPEENRLSAAKVRGCEGICSDVVAMYKDLLEKPIG